MDSDTTSRSSSQSSGASVSKNDDKIKQIAEQMISKFKEDVVQEIQEKLTSEVVEPVSENIMKTTLSHVDDVMKEETAQLVVAMTIADKQLREKHLGKSGKSQARCLINQAIEKAMKKNFSLNWQDLSMMITEEATDDIEAELWGEMGAHLQHVFRHYRNTGAELNLEKGAGLEMCEDRLEALLLRVQANNKQRAHFLATSTRQYVEEMMKCREQEVKMHLELELKTLRRELVQIKQNADLLNANTTSSSCVIL